MIDLGTGPAPSTLDAVSITLDEMELLSERLDLVELPVVLNAVTRYDNDEDRAVAFAAASQSLAERGLLHGNTVHPELADRLVALIRPHWLIAMRLFVGDSISRLCLAKGDDRTVLVLRGPDSYVVDQVDGDLSRPVIAALGKTGPLDFGGLNVPTRQLSEAFHDVTDPVATAARLVQLGAPEAEAGKVASAMLHCFAHTEIVGVVYGDGSRDVAPGNIAVFDTKDGRFIVTASWAADGTKWSALSSGTDARLRKALLELISSLPERATFPHKAH